MIKKKIASKAAGIVAGALGAAALAAVGTGAAALWKWAKDPNATVFWIGCLPGGKGIRIEKGEEANNYRVQTGYRWRDDAAEDELGAREVTEIEIELPTEPLPEEPAPTAAEPETAEPEAAEAEAAEPEAAE